ncbi:RNA ligase-domain-containing protein [Russula earlei]|uniref:RNA ligase-domain-containing protein n=1 Tax=Russula earlei TaxID=71964 RepID=A0ACC0UIS9_9AGAM|nr:RNA ligase-domain-containing protein [Russula earlei]
MAYKPFSHDDSQLIADLHSLHKNSPKSVKPVQYAVPAVPEITVESWRMNEFRYYDVPSPFPTLARGLFSVEEKGRAEGQAQYRIVARGYDKFFNVGEVLWTNWSSLEAHTKPPYTLTLKSNGCIIFIAALSPSKLLITSKHSLGPIQGTPESHAQAGERWLLRHLEQVGKTTEQLAKVLWEKNWTAVAELCDDSFEEHVLPYSAEQTGLHLHGLNECSRHFQTQSTAVVDEFAREWGLIVTASFELPSIPEVKSFTEAIALTGKWNGEALEGFVVRTTVSSPRGSQGDAIAPPYPPGSPLFFKVKFDQPYIMYREWREITKFLLSKGEPANVPQNKMKRPETKTYVEWVRQEIKSHPELFEGYTNGHGIIATRNRFLKWLETEDGKRSKKQFEVDEKAIQPSGKQYGKTIIMPIAIPGAGKTSISVALAELFHFGHTQSDDIPVKRSAPLFIQNVKELLQEYDVVIADKNNHLHQHRKELRDATEGMHPPVRLLALNWSLDQPHAVIHRMCADRILVRGANHQTLPGDAPDKSHEQVVWRFLKNTDRLDAKEADATVEMDISEDLEHSLARAIDGIVRVLGLPRPDPERVGVALSKARAYKPAQKNAKMATKAPSKPRYFGLLAEINLVDALDAHISRQEGMLHDFWNKLKADGRVSRYPHVTIVHSRQLPEECDLWNRCVALYRLTSPPLFCARLDYVVANERLIAVTVENLSVEGEGKEGSTFISQLDPQLRERLHITIGCKDSSVSSVEAGALVESFKKGEKGIDSVPLEAVHMKARIGSMFS